MPFSPEQAMPPAPPLGKPLQQVDQASVNYRPGLPSKSCAGCVNFLPPSACTAVKGKIAPEGVCDLWSGKSAAGYDATMADEVLGGPALMEGRMP